MPTGMVNTRVHPKDGGRHQPGVAAQQGVLRQLFGQLVAAHVDGQKASEHGGVHADEPVQRDNGVPKPLGQHRGQANHARHGKRHRAQQHEACLELVPQPPFVAPQPVKAAKRRPGRHNRHKNLIHAHT